MTAAADLRRCPRGAASGSRRAPRARLPLTQDRRGIRVAAREEERVGVRLRRVAQARHSEVPHPFGHPRRDERVPPGKECDHERDAAERARNQERGEGEDEPEENRDPLLAHRRIDREVDLVRALAPREAREPAPDEVDERDEVRRVAHVGGEEAVQRLRQPSECERDQPGEEPDEEDPDRPQQDPDEVGNREEEAEEDGEARPAEVVGDDRSHGVLGQVRVRLGLGGIGRRIARCQEEQVATCLRAVADRERDEVSQPARSTAECDREEPREEGRRRGRAADGRDVPPQRVLGAARGSPRCLTGGAGREPTSECGCEEEGGNREEEAEEPSPAALPHGPVDLEVDRVPVLAPKPRIRIRREEHVRAHLRRIADVRRDEVVQAVRHLALDEHGEPVDEADDERRDPAQHHPDEHGDREEQPEEHREPVATEVVVADDEPDRPLGGTLHGRIVARRPDVGLRRERAGVGSGEARHQHRVSGPCEREGAWSGPGAGRTRRARGCSEYTTPSPAVPRTIAR